MQPCYNGLDLPEPGLGERGALHLLPQLGKPGILTRSIRLNHLEAGLPQRQGVSPLSAQPSHLLANPEAGVVQPVPTGWGHYSPLHPVTVSISTSLSLPPFPLPWVSPDQQPLLCQRKLGQPTPYTRRTGEGEAKSKGWGALNKRL